MSVSNEFLLSVYEKCNDHLKEQSKKRDQTIAFYLVVISFYFGSHANINKLLVGQYTPILFSFVLCIVGGMVIRTLSGLRSWHIQYANAIMIINNVMAKDIKTTAEINSEINYFLAEKKTTYKTMTVRHIFSGVENRVILAMTFISGFPVLMLAKELSIAIGIRDVNYIFLIEALFYITYVSYYFYNTIENIRKSADQVTWIIKFEE